ncbi:MAG: hypothetical protein JWO81_2246 [Alphaproteobacteria bacterium]|nr:hypothetical protein [Alphaproteobacteria bacterium]
MKLCIVSPQAYPLLQEGGKGYAGGAELQLWNLAGFCRASGIDVDFIVDAPGGPRTEWREGVRIVKSFTRGDRTKLRAAKALGRFVADLFMSKADVYVTSCAGAPAGVIAMVARLAGKRFVYRTAHEIDCNGVYERQNGLRGRLYGHGLRAAHRVVTQNEEHRTFLAARGVLPVVIRNGFFIGGPPPADAPRPIDALWVARSDAWKNPDMFLDVAEAMPDRHFLMISPRGNDHGFFERIAERADRLPNLRFIAGAPFAETAAYFGQAKLFVGTSEAEGFPNTYLQACMAGTPIVTYKVNPDSFVTRQEIGLCADGSFERLLEQVRRLLSDEAERLRLGQNAYAYARASHDIEGEGRKWLKLFRELTAEEPSDAPSRLAKAEDL